MKKRILKVLLGAILIILFLYLFAKYIKLPCIFHKITGLYCPGCGMTRAINSLFELDIMTAIKYNLLIVILIPFFGYYIIKTIYNYIIENKLLHLHQVYNIYILYTITGICLLYGIIRNLDFFPKM